MIQATVRVVGLVRGHNIDKGAEAELTPEALVLTWHEPAAPWRISVEGIDGVVYRVRDCTLYLADGDVLELTGDDRVRTMALQLLDYACAMPELTRGLRAFGSLRGAPGAAHDAWFAPLLNARRSVEGVSDPQRQLALLDAATLARAMEASMGEIAALERPGDLPAQRAVEAAIEEAAEGMFVSFDRLELAADTLRGSSPDTVLADWRRWTRALRDVFAAADEAWGRAHAELR